MLLAQKSYTEGALALNLYCAKLVDEERAARAAGDAVARERATLLLDILTPIAKSWPSQWCLEANNLAIQVHGGYGYTREYNVEQFYRDNRLNPIHEGTHGIHGLDLLGRKVMMKDGTALGIVSETVRAGVIRALATRDAELHEYAHALSIVMGGLTLVTQRLWEAGDPTLTLANASVYLEAFGHIVLAWIWLEQAIAELPELKQLDETFKPPSLGTDADATKMRVEWRQLRNRTVNDPTVQAAKAFAQAARTDLEKRNRLRDYYNIYYQRMSALTTNAEIKLALEGFKTGHQVTLAQPRVRPTPPGSPTPVPPPAQKKQAHKHKKNKLKK